MKAIKLVNEPVMVSGAITREEVRVVAAAPMGVSPLAAGEAVTKRRTIWRALGEAVSAKLAANK